MAFDIHIKGEDSLDDGEKVAFERHLVEEVRAFVARFAVKPGVSVTDGSVAVDTQDEVSFKPVEEVAEDG
jgi:hypothetical protein